MQKMIVIIIRCWHSDMMGQSRLQAQTRYSDHSYLPISINNINVFIHLAPIRLPLNNGVQFTCNRVSVPFLQDKREALLDSVLGYLERDIREISIN
jgi:hypothetical protein